MSLHYFDEKESDIDEDGQPLTVTAALRLYHKNDDTKKVFISKPQYSNPLDSMQ